MVDTGHLARAAGNLRAQNMVSVGAASNLLDFTEDQLLDHVEGLFARKGEKIVVVNRKAFLFGRAAGPSFAHWSMAGIAPVKAVKLCRQDRRLRPSSRPRPGLGRGIGGTTPTD